MARFPIVQRPCPYKLSLAEIIDGETCRVCRRKVHDLGAMGETQRMAFLDACSDEICVRYTLPLPRKVAALAMSAAVMALPVAADEQTTSPAADTVRSESAYHGVEEAEEAVIVIGGIKERSRREYVDDTEDATTPELPVVYESAAGEE